MLKINIPNKSRRFLKGYSSPVLTVPAPCQALTRIKQNEWFVRAYYEYKNCVDNGGSVWFPTLTYNNENINYWNDEKYNYYIPCFSADDICSFRKKLNVYLKRAGFDFTGDKKIRYICCAEFGGKYGRPHYHCLLFVPDRIDYKLMSSLIKKSWSNGFVMYSKKGMLINNVSAIKYVMKYISKDFDYFNKFNVPDYIKTLKLNNEKDLLLAFKKVLPRHYQSLGFGLVGLDKLSFKDFENNFIDSGRLGLYDSNSFKYPVPSYYKRKYMYDYDKKNCLFNLNKKGYYVLKSRFDDIINNIQFQYDKFILNLNNYIKHPLLKLFSDYLSCLFKNVDTKLLSVYSLCYRFRYMPKDILQGCKIVREAFIDTAFDIFIRSKDVKFLPVSDSFRHDYYKYDELFNSHPVFNGFDNIINVFDTVNSIIDSRKEEYQQKEVIRLSNIFLKDNYVKL